MNRFLLPKLLTLVMLLLFSPFGGVRGSFLFAQTIGGDLSLLPAYEKAGQPFYTEDGQLIPDLLNFLRDEAGWNAVRVRLMVDPSLDTDVSTQQDMEYVMAFGKRIKDAGMLFLLDIFYSDTWTDPAQQWIPTSWGCDKRTAIEALAKKVKIYTTESLNLLCEAGARPDFVQIGNEVSYGMLWDNLAGKDQKTNAFWLDPKWNTYDENVSGKTSQKKNVDRTASLLKAASEGVRASEAADAKIILHIERSGVVTEALNFYSWIDKAGMQDYDIIGLSYYPFWHGSLAALSETIHSLHNAFPAKEIQVVETAWNYQWGPSDAVCRDWPYSKAGQAQFLNDLVNTLCTLPVTGLYYWCPEENGNGSTAHPVMSSWLNRGLWDNSTHRLNSRGVLEAFKSCQKLTGISTPQRGAVEKMSNPSRFLLNGQALPRHVDSGIYIYNSRKYVKHP